VHDGAQDRLDTPLRGAPEWLSFAAIPEILDMVSQLIGPDLILWGTTLFGKPARCGRETPWHQDAMYWPIDPPATCSVWIALDDAASDNGCLRVVHGSHRARQTMAHRTVGERDVVLSFEAEAAADADRCAHDVELRAGQISLHDIHLLHGSNANRSGRRRAAFVLRLMPAASLFDRALGARWAQEGRRLDFSRRRIILMRGANRHQGNDFSIGAAAGVPA